LSGQDRPARASRTNCDGKQVPLATIQRKALMQELTALEAIRLISGVVADNKTEMCTRLYLCNLLARHLMGLDDPCSTYDMLKNAGVELMECKCEDEDNNLVEGPFGPHAAKKVCGRCGRFLKWVSKKELEDGRDRKQS